VEKNVDFIQRKRDEVSFGPRDTGSADSFLQFEKGNGNASFTQFYKSAIARGGLVENNVKRPGKRKRHKAESADGE
ncbi:hypothetical protein Dimus_021173, partial [Dionaea muscipula]